MPTWLLHSPAIVSIALPPSVSRATTTASSLFLVPSPHLTRYLPAIPSRAVATLRPPCRLHPFRPAITVPLSLHVVSYKGQNSSASSPCHCLSPYLAYLVLKSVHLWLLCPPFLIRVVVSSLALFSTYLYSLRHHISVLHPCYTRCPPCRRRSTLSPSTRLSCPRLASGKCHEGFNDYPWPPSPCHLTPRSFPQSIVARAQSIS